MSPQQWFDVATDAAFGAESESERETVSRIPLDAVWLDEGDLDLAEEGGA